MLLIRRTQQEKLEEAKLNSFEGRMIEHLNRFFPEQCQGLGEVKTAEAVRYGISRAESYGITTERDVCKYIDLMFAFGRDFDKDPELPWAAKILKDPQIPNGTERINRLYAKSKMEVLAAAGK